MIFIGNLILILLSSLILGQISTRLNMPAVIGELVCGFVLGPAILNWIQPSNLIDIFSQLGVILLLFLAGLESDLTLLKKYFKLSFTIATIGVLLPIILIGLTCYFWGIRPQEAIFIGIVFAATSVSISVVVLQEQGQLHSRAGTAILGAAVVDDILAVIALSLFTACSQKGKTSGPTNNPILNFSLEIGFLGFLWLIYRLTPQLMHLANKMTIAHAPNIIALILVFTLVWCAEYVGLSAVIGAFFGGLALRQTPQHKKISHTISTIGYSIFIPFFFTNIGLAITFNSLGHDLIFICIMTILAIVSKFWAGKYSSLLFGFSKNEGNIVGAGMISRGEVALIVSQLGQSQHLFSQDVYSSLIFVIIISTILSPFILNHFIKIQAAPNK
ncbi:cation:proton antiporter [Lactobacillus sp. ESL0785]|uniref:cation:proton antiporter n=1 Tax=Lactobacillus sp. ESL0785 TaxID=2983232 RepID=UPI0023F638F0|nr:cation:proton antiporter [Lactobacillus sp. ESL0785]WEV70843.1 cation:proton antiporter [Lactobacillus sp. ESL0785]